jgi:hypothetical protein
MALLFTYWLHVRHRFHETVHVQKVKNKDNEFHVDICGFLSFNFFSFFAASKTIWKSDLRTQSTYIYRVSQCMSPRPNWDSPTLSQAGECAPPPRNQRGGVGTLACG